MASSLGLVQGRAEGPGLGGDRPSGFGRLRWRRVCTCVDKVRKLSYPKEWAYGQEQGVLTRVAQL